MLGVTCAEFRYAECRGAVAGTTNIEGMPLPRETLLKGTS
jgi:hypothetical protein